MNIKTKTKEDNDENGLVYNHDEARVLATVITTFNEHMECIVSNGIDLLNEIQIVLLNVKTEISTSYPSSNEIQLLSFSAGMSNSGTVLPMIQHPSVGTQANTIRTVE